MEIPDAMNPTLPSLISPSLAIAMVASAPAGAATTYAEDIAFLRQYTEIVELGEGDAKVAVAPRWQGRVMTSTAGGGAAEGFGWIGRETVQTGILPEAERTGLNRHIHVFGGEERLWLGPEGGRFALFFPPGVKQEFEHWKTPAVLDTEAFAIDSKSTTAVSFRHRTTLRNRAGTELVIGLARKVEISDPAAVERRVGMPLPPAVKAVGYTTSNTVTNHGEQPWTRGTGAPSVWLLGMFKPSPSTVVVIPLAAGSADSVNTNYIGFGAIPEDRARISDGILFLKGDGKVRGKLGVAPRGSKGIAGSWQADRGVLTLVRFDPPAEKERAEWPYVDSQWSDDLPPFSGDVINAYNDGPPEPGAKPLGPFYEIESSSPALFLKPGEAHTHIQTTLHLSGPREVLDAIAKGTLGAGLDTIEKSLP
jgi:hypothetical protein